jgi:hypothetical protein
VTRTVGSVAWEIADWSCDGPRQRTVSRTVGSVAWEMADWSCSGPRRRTMTRTVGSVAVLVVESSEARSNGCERSRSLAVRYLAILVI